MLTQTELMLHKAIKAFQDGRFEIADSILQDVLSKNSNSIDIVFDLGIAYIQANRLAEASKIFLSLQPYKKDDVRIPYNLGLIYSLQGKHKFALDAYDLALKISPNDLEVLINKSSTLIDIKNHELALQLLDVVIKMKPEIPEAWSNKGIALKNLNFHEDAINAFDEAIKLNPNFYEAWVNKLNTLFISKRLLEACEVCDQIISLRPNYPESWFNKGVALHKLKFFQEAITQYDKALSLKPDYPECLSNRGLALYEIKNYDAAISNYDIAISIDPQISEAWLNKGLVMRELKNFDEALVLCNKAISLNPNFAEAISNKAAILVDLKQYDNAIINFNDALKIEFGLDWVYGDLIHTKMKICDWSESAEHLKLITPDHKVVRPFILLALNDDISLHKKISDLYTLSNYPLITNLGNIPKRPQDQRIRVGYFSADFHNHATGNLIAELFELHDKSQFEIIAFSFGPVKNDEMSQRLKRSFDQFIQVGEMSDFAISKLSRNLNIDIGVDLKGFTQDARTGIFAYRAAPIQVNYLGYPGTMGAEYIDYIIADKILIPVEYQSYYSEKVVYLPNSYQVNDRKRAISDKKFTRSDLGLPETGFIFCNFNNNFKITPATFNSWMRILRAVEGSSLWLLQDNFWVVNNLKREAEKQGISAHRLIFAERLALNEHLARHCQADLFLDTFPYNAHTTASDALWTGLPIVTLMGKSFASRVAASLLNAVGLPELITTNENQYEALAIDLATRPNKLNEIRLKLANNRLTTPLFDTPLFAKNLEAAYIKMYKRYQANLEPDHIILNIDL